MNPETEADIIVAKEAAAGPVLDQTLVDRCMNYHGPVLVDKLAEEQVKVELPHFLALSQMGTANKDTPRDTEFEDKLVGFISRKADLLFSKRPNNNVAIQENHPGDSGYYAVVTPLESLMAVSDDDKHRHFFTTLEIGDIVIGNVSAIQESGLTISLLCCDNGKSRDIQHLRINCFCPIKEVPRIYAHEHALEAYAIKDKVRGVVVNTAADTERIILSMMPDALPVASQHVKLGLIPDEDIPESFRVLKRMGSKSYKEQLKTSVGFTNPCNVATLTSMLGLEEDKSLSFMRSLFRYEVQPSEYVEALRKKQSYKWALKNVEAGVRMFKEGQHTEAMQQLNKALQIDAENVEALVARGCLYANNDSYARALEDFEEALQINPRHANAQKYMCETLLAHSRSFMDQDKAEKAVPYLQRVLELEPSRSEAQRWLNEIRQKQAEKQRLDFETEKASRRKSDDVVIIDPNKTGFEKTSETLRKLIEEEKEHASRHIQTPKKKKKRKHGSPDASSEVVWVEASDEVSKASADQKSPVRQSASEDRSSDRDRNKEFEERRIADRNREPEDRRISDRNRNRELEERRISDRDMNRELEERRISDQNRNRESEDRRNFDPDRKRESEDRRISDPDKNRESDDRRRISDHQAQGEFHSSNGQGRYRSRSPSQVHRSLSPKTRKTSVERRWESTRSRSPEYGINEQPKPRTHETEQRRHSSHVYDNDGREKRQADDEHLRTLAEKRGFTEERYPERKQERPGEYPERYRERSPEDKKPRIDMDDSVNYLQEHDASFHDLEARILKYREMEARQSNEHDVHMEDGEQKHQKNYSRSGPESTQQGRPVDKQKSYEQAAQEIFITVGQSGREIREKDSKTKDYHDDGHPYQRRRRDSYSPSDEVYDAIYGGQSEKINPERDFKPTRRSFDRDQYKHEGHYSADDQDRKHMYHESQQLREDKSRYNKSTDHAGHQSTSNARYGHYEHAKTGRRESFTKDTRRDSFERDASLKAKVNKGSEEKKDKSASGVKPKLESPKKKKEGSSTKKKKDGSSTKKKRKRDSSSSSSSSSSSDSSSSSSSSSDEKSKKKQKQKKKKTKEKKRKSSSGKDLKKVHKLTETSQFKEAKSVETELVVRLKSRWDSPTDEDDRRKSDPASFKKPTRRTTGFHTRRTHSIFQPYRQRVHPASARINPFIYNHRNMANKKPTDSSVMQASQNTGKKTATETLEDLEKFYSMLKQKKKQEDTKPT